MALSGARRGACGANSGPTTRKSRPPWAVSPGNFDRAAGNSDRPNCSHSCGCWPSGTGKPLYLQMRKYRCGRLARFLRLAGRT
ncbi:hypothetical protein AZA_36200 [Nitrospirillum viridazoti Y2]|nr:hypothetical protein AZA_36200 [Nitrospirillum amazonense Y2]